jgi:hypothetical protein
MILKSNIIIIRIFGKPGIRAEELVECVFVFGFGFFFGSTGV